MPPNIIYLNSHDTGRHLQPYGQAIATPALQRMAEAGTVFRRCFSAAPTCCPSRAAAVTGRSAHAVGVLGLVGFGWGLRSPDLHVRHHLGRAGYRSYLAGIQHVMREGPEDPNPVGYDQVLTTAGQRLDAEAVTVACEHFLHSAAAGSAPFFLEIGYFPTHRPFTPDGPEDWAASRYLAVPPPLPDHREIRGDLAAFARSAALLDRCIGRVLAALDAAGIADDTVVVYTTDHGIPFPFMKCACTDHGTGVAMIMRGPGVPTGAVCDGLVSQLDLVPSWCELAGIDPPPGCEGRSLLPLLRGEVEAIRDQVTSEVSWHVAYEPQRAVRTQRWLYLRRFGDRPEPVYANCDGSLSKDRCYLDGWSGGQLAAEQLFDCLSDPTQACNLSRDPAHATTLHAMRRRLETWMADTDDPLRHGPIPLPAGCSETAPDAWAPPPERDGPWAQPPVRSR